MDYFKYLDYVKSQIGERGDLLSYTLEISSPENVYTSKL